MVSVNFGNVSQFDILHLVFKNDCLLHVCVCPQAGMSMIMFITSDILELINYVAFASNLLNLVNIAAFFWLRYKQPDRYRPLKVSNNDP